MAIDKDRFLNILEDIEHDEEVEKKFQEMKDEAPVSVKGERTKPVERSAAERSLRTQVYMSGELVPVEAVEEYKRKVHFGHKSKFREEMLEEVIVVLAEGRTRHDLAAMLGIGTRTLLAWCEKGGDSEIPQFREAVEYGEALSGLWWREIGRRNLMNKEFNSNLWMMNMQNRFGWTRRWEGDMSMKQITEEKKTIEIKIEERTVEHVAEILRILSEAGAIAPGNDEPLTAEAYEVCPS